MKGKGKNNTVKKALSPEETAVVENIGSLIEQLKSSGSVETDVMEAGIVPEDDEYEEEEDDMVEKESNGPTANPTDKAEDRVEDGTDITEGNLSEVGKSLQLLIKQLQPKKVVRKSATPRVNQIDPLVMKSLAEISTVMKSLADQQNQQNLAISNILEGIGFTETVQKAQSVQKSKNTPVGALGNEAVAEELLKVIKSLSDNQNKEQRPYSNFNVRKNQHDELRDSMSSIFNVRK